MCERRACGILRPPDVCSHLAVAGSSLSERCWAYTVITGTRPTRAWQTNSVHSLGLFQQNPHHFISFFLLFSPFGFSLAPCDKYLWDEMRAGVVYSPLTLSGEICKDTWPKHHTQPPPSHLPLAPYREETPRWQNPQTLQLEPQRPQNFSFFRRAPVCWCFEARQPRWTG